MNDNELDVATYWWASQGTALWEVELSALKFSSDEVSRSYGCYAILVTAEINTEVG